MGNNNRSANKGNRMLGFLDACLQVSEKIETLLREKIQPFKVEIAKDPTKAVILVSEFEASIHTPAMVWL